MSFDQGRPGRVEIVAYTRSYEVISRGLGLQLLEVALMASQRFAHRLVRVDELPRLVFSRDGRRQIVEQAARFEERRVCSVQRFVEALAFLSKGLGHGFL